ncbi:MAG: hypothetical protein JEY71_15690 [Sphaerochaeta sp.]|nr:hypothetical protein [Sphaerochaeta sp.]
MHDKRKQKLMSLGSETLADTLLDMAGHIQQVDDRVNRLVAPKKENLVRYRQKIAALHTLTKYIEYEKADAFADRLTEMLEDLQSGITEPYAGLELVAEFYETDNEVFEMCDDSDGTIGDVYLTTAKDLFFHYASSCQDIEKVVTIFLKLASIDDYGARSSLMENITDSFAEPILTAILKRLKVLEATEKEERKKGSYARMIRFIGSQQQEAKLFEDALQGKEVELPTLRMLEVARILLERNDVESALAWIKKIPANNFTNSYAIDEILKEIYARQGDTESLIALHYTNFKSHRTIEDLQELLLVMGQEKRDEVLAEELIQICKNPAFISDDAQFLADVKMIDELEAYMFARVDRLNGGDYYSLPEIAQELGNHGRYLAASMLYRSLLDSMMERAYAKSYHHGVDYLKAMDAFAPLIKDWKSFPSHNAYKVHLLQENKRKTSFWSQYMKK